MPNLLDSFLQKVDKTDSCWNWKSWGDQGYGRLRINGKKVLAHRVSYELLKGPIPDGLELDHLCRNRKCVNPEHLEPVTSGENNRRGISPSAINITKTHCPKGHRYDVVFQNTKGLARGCKECWRVNASVRYYRRMKKASQSA